MNIGDLEDFNLRHTGLPGAFCGVPFDLYGQQRGVSQSALSTFARSPLDRKREMDGRRPFEPTEAMQLGSIMHALVLEDRADFYTKPETYGPENKKWNGNATECKQWLADHADKPVVSLAKSLEIKSAAQYIRAHPRASGFLQNGFAEVSAFGTDAATGQAIKGRFDYIIPGDFATIVDLKTTQDATTEELAKTIRFRRYHVQAALYRRLAIQNGAAAVRYIFIAVEQNAGGPKVNVKELNPRALDLGESILDADLARYAECKRSGIWPEWSDEGAGVACVDLPDWCYPSEEIDLAK